MKYLINPIKSFSILATATITTAMSLTLLTRADRATAATLDWDSTGWQSGQTSGLFDIGGGQVQIDISKGSETQFSSFNGNQTPDVNAVLNGANPDTNQALHLQIDTQKIGAIPENLANNQVTLAADFLGYNNGVVDDVTFDLFDIDVDSLNSTNYQWQDRVIVKGFLDGAVIDPIFNIFNTNHTAQIDPYTLEGIKGVANDVDDGTVSVSFSSAIDRLEVLFTDGDDTLASNPAFHGIGIGDISFREIPPEPKPVPEPSIVLGLGSIGLLVSRCSRRRSQN
ncbi:MAG: hypothetical protein J7647_15005 [Cyanobacteria bacterium SBLK]|nr:hypothetical protein [Cyanobacteria bacterium SBLK]